VLYARRDHAWVLRFEGAIRYTIAHAVNHFLDELFAHEHPVSICIDLNGTTSIDSTGIGLLAKVANGLRHAGYGRPVVFSDNPEIVEILSNVCMDEACILVHGAASMPATELVPPTTPGERDIALTVLEAHRLLCELCEHNRAMFQSVVDALERDVGKH
jgi:anti-anti-sigma factor